MRALPIAVLISVAACSTTPIRPVPQVDWTRGTPVYLVLADSNESDENKAILKTDLEEDLHAAGFRVETAPGAPGELSLHVGVAGISSTVTVQVQQDSLQVDQFSFDWLGLNCNAFTSGETTLHCGAREVVARLLESTAVAAALSKKRPAQAVAENGHRVAVLSGKLAVLDLRNLTSELTRDNAQYFTDVVRQAALRSQPQLEVMTRENLMVLLQASGKKLEECEGECEVDTGRRIGADAIVSGEIQKLGSSYKLTLRLHDTHEGRLLASAIASGKSIDELDQSASKAADELFH